MKEDVFNCIWPDLHYLIFTDYIPPLIYYSHIPAFILSLLFGIFVFSKNRTRQGVSFLSITIFFSLWVSFNLILWVSPNTALIIFLWSLFGILYGLIFVSSFYFFEAFTNSQGTEMWKKLSLGLLLLPIILLTPTKLNLGNFLLTDCTVIEGVYFSNYYYLVGIIIFLLIMILGIIRYKKSHDNQKKKIFLVTLGIEFFLLSFITGSSFASYLNKINPSDLDYNVEQYGLFGMTFFIGIIAFLIVKYKAFNIKLIGTQALIISLWFLVGSFVFIAQSNTTRAVAGITFLFTVVAGHFLIRSVQREVRLREQIEDLVIDLEKANVRLKVLDKMKSEFVSIASHQLRSPLTSIRGYASMLLEGSYGKLSQKATEIIGNIADASKYMALSVEDYLNVSRIEAGNMKYEMSDLSLKNVAEKVVDELRSIAMKRGLVLVFRSDCTSNATIHADIGKTRQVIMNIIDNAIKYTLKGTITVFAHDDIKKKKMHITIQDTGVGMSKETLEEVFDKFVRAKNANDVNVTGTGLGLYVARKMITDMNGSIRAESKGEGMGSTFHIEFPLV